VAAGNGYPPPMSCVRMRTHPQNPDDVTSRNRKLKGGVQKYVAVKNHENMHENITWHLRATYGFILSNYAEGLRDRERSGDVSGFTSSWTPRHKVTW
jgi:hypothetical protein